ncbi:hypothetical protein [Micromonospora sp. NPDC023956]|uniref:hypothetical protein n=1 Tax=Micromonospora sp. NPDC023956 TaxID=3155722 RepID=UPI00340A38C3
MEVLPTKFESVLRMGALNYAPLILKVDRDLRQFSKLLRFNMAQGAGTLAVVHNPPGKGKTTAVYAAAVLLRESFKPVISVPPQFSLPLRNIPEWVVANISGQIDDRATLVLIDGRESTDDEQGLRDVMGALNNLVRGRPDLLFVWPTTDESWRDRLVGTARSFGSESFCPDRAVFSIDGPAKSQWVEAVGLILDQLNQSWDEFGINESSASELVDQYSTLGEFFTGINQIRVDQEDFSENITGLPEVIFVVSSHSQVVGHVARLRNPNTYRLRTDEVISSARFSEPGKFWRSRGATQKSNLAWVSSLLQAKLVALTPSTVAHACGIESQAGSPIRNALSGLDFSPNRSTGRTAYKTTDLARFLAGEPVPEVLTTNKGKTSEYTLTAYDAIQALSSKQHRSINEAILKFVGDAGERFDPRDVKYEVPLGGDAIVDAIVPVDNRRLHLEFHHLSSAHCTPNKIASYMMKKLRVYATQYNLIER